MHFIGFYNLVRGNFIFHMINWELFVNPCSSYGILYFVRFSVNSIQPTYSVFKLFTGLANAAFIAWKLTVISAITMDNAPAIANIHQVTGTL